MRRTGRRFSTQMRTVEGRRVATRQIQELQACEVAPLARPGAARRAGLPGRAAEVDLGERGAERAQTGWQAACGR